jgi:hypothetical protein
MKAQPWQQTRPHHWHHHPQQRNHWQHFTQQHDTHIFCDWPLWLGPILRHFLIGTRPTAPLSFPPSWPHAAEMYKCITTFPSPTGILQLSNHTWTIQQPCCFFGHSYSSPTPSISTLQALGHCISKSFAAHIHYATCCFCDHPPAHIPHPTVHILAPTYADHQRKDPILNIYIYISSKGKYQLMSVNFTPLLLNSARCISSAFSKLCSSMENIHVSKYNSTSRCILARCFKWYMGCPCKFLWHVGATTGLKMKLKLLKIPKTKKTDKAIIIQVSDWAWNTSRSWCG